MSGTLKFRTNLNCNACVAAVKPHLDNESSIASWDVDIATPDKILTVHGESVSAEEVRTAVAKSGFRVLGELPASPPMEEHQLEQVTATTYYPLILLLIFLSGIVGLVELAAGSFDWERAMGNFMGGFFLTFSFFKLLNLPGFADSYQMYDIVAQRWRAYAYAYPFIELLLGAAYLTGFQPVFTNVVTLIVMLVSSVGVLKSLHAKRKVRCACLGTVFNLPMSTVTLVEDSLMVLMAAVMLSIGSHGSIGSRHEASQPGTSLQHAHVFHIHHSHPYNNGAGVSLLLEGELIHEADRPSVLRMRFHDADGAIVNDFETVHGEQVHLAIVRNGLDTFAHLHPQVDAEGHVVVPYTFPVGGTYHLFADIQPAGGEPTSVSTRLDVAGDSPLAPLLKADVPGRVQVAGVIADVAVEYVGAGREAMIRFELFREDGQPVQDLRPYLETRGHLQIISQDGQDYVHAHPQAPESDEMPHVVRFHAVFNKAGLHKGWGQFQLSDGVHVIPVVADIR